MVYVVFGINLVHAVRLYTNKFQSCSVLIDSGKQTVSTSIYTDVQALTWCNATQVMYTVGVVIHCALHHVGLLS